MTEENAYGLLMKGRELLEEGHPSKAAFVLEKARRMEPEKGSILEALGRAYYNSGRHIDAMYCFDKAVDVDPTNDYAHYCLGMCHLRNGNSMRAGRHLKLAWSLRPHEMYREMVYRYGFSDGPPEIGGMGVSHTGEE